MVTKERKGNSMIDDLDIDLDVTEAKPLITTELATDAEMTIQELYETLIMKEDIILTIAEKDYEFIKRSLTAHKAKENTKLKDKGMPIDTNKLQFLNLDCPSCDIGNVKLQISLLKRKTFSIKKIESPSQF